MQHLLDFFDRYIRGRREALRFDDGLRQWSFTSNQLRVAAEAFAERLIAADLRPGDRLVIWSENRPEWLAAFWGCILRGVAVIPLGAQATPDLVARIVDVATPRGMIVGEDVAAPTPAASMFVWRLRDIDWLGLSHGAPAGAERTVRAAVDADTVAEIVFTSGTTGDPKGVVITHGNVIANITPVERAVAEYRHLLWLLRPLRFLVALPLSHMFGQALAVFLTPLVKATTVFGRQYRPDDLVRQMRRHRITLVATVPRVLDLLRRRVRQLARQRAEPTATSLTLPRRLWRYRDVHRMCGWRFCGFVVGGAQLDPELEEFWRRLGFAVIQGYGLTETAPIVAWNHPFRTKHGTVGTPLEGVDVRLAADGEVLVRGQSVTTGYLTSPGMIRSALEDGWFHTGDLGSFDASGHLRIRGRKKDVIVTAEGIHVFPEEVERVLDTTPGVREAAVVSRADDGEHVHAVLVLQPDADAGAVVRQANARLDSHQRIRNFSIWPQPALPRTEAIHKLKREAIRRWVAAGAPGRLPSSQPAVRPMERMLAAFASNQPVDPQTTLEELGLTSLDRIELALALEEQLGVTVSETAIAESRTAGDLRRAVEEASRHAPADEPFAFPRWTRGLPARAVRTASQSLWILPLARAFLRLQVEGAARLDDLPGPVIFAANHQSHLDTPAILLSLPRRWRRRVTVAMAKEFFEAYFEPAGRGIGERLSAGALYLLAVLFFNAFPLPRSGPGARATLRYAGTLATAGLSILIFPEGHRTERGEIKRFQPGVGMLASQLRLPVIPVRLEGLDRVLHHGSRWPRRGPVRVTFGAPIDLEGQDYAALAARVEQAVRALSPGAGESATPDAA